MCGAATGSCAFFRLVILHVLAPNSTFLFLFWDAESDKLKSFVIHLLLVG